MQKLSFPPIGVGLAYYNTITHRLDEAIRGYLRDGLPIVEIEGCAYQEMARGEICRRALNRFDEGLRCLVLIDPSMTPPPAVVRSMAEYALHKRAIVAPMWSPERVAYASTHETTPPLSGAAIPIELLKAIVEHSRKTESPFYNTPSCADIDPASEFYPIFSPFGPDGRSVIQGVRVHPDEAFLHRARQAGVPILGYGGPFKPAAPPPPITTVERNLRNARSNYLIGIATFGGLNTIQRRLLWELEKNGSPIFEIHNHPHIDTARDILAQKAIDLSCSGVVMLDHDILFVPIDLLNLCKEAERLQSVVGVPYCMRKSGHSIVGAFTHTRGEEIGFFHEGGIYPAAYTGMGFTAIPKKILQLAQTQVPPEPLRNAFGSAQPLFGLRIENGYYAGEDVSFCTRVHDIDGRQLDSGEWVMKPKQEGRIFLDTRPRIFHQGDYRYGIEDAGMVVPRVSHLKSRLTATCAETLELLLEVDSLSPEIQAQSLGVATGVNADHKHPVLQ